MYSNNPQFKKKRMKEERRKKMKKIKTAMDMVGMCPTVSITTINVGVLGTPKKDQDCQSGRQQKKI